MDEDSVEEMELGEIELDEIKKEGDKKGRGMFLEDNWNYSRN